MSQNGILCVRFHCGFRTGGIANRFFCWLFSDGYTDTALRDPEVMELKSDKSQHPYDRARHRRDMHRHEQFHPSREITGDSL